MAAATAPAAPSAPFGGGTPRCRPWVRPPCSRPLGVDVKLARCHFNPAPRHEVDGQTAAAPPISSSCGRPSSLPRSSALGTPRQARLRLQARQEAERKEVADCIEALFKQRKATLRFLRRCEEPQELLALQGALDPQPRRTQSARRPNSMLPNTAMLADVSHSHCSSPRRNARHSHCSSPRGGVAAPFPSAGFSETSLRPPFAFADMADTNAGCISAHGPIMTSSGMG